MKRALVFLAILVLIGVGAISAGQLGLGPVVITREDQQKIVLRFGEVRRTTDPGVSLRWPFIDNVETYERRWIYLSTEALPIQTKDGEELVVDNYVVWRIGDAVKFKKAFPNGTASAPGRIDRVVRDDVREVIGRHTLTEVLNDQRVPIMTDIASKTRESLAEWGIAVADVRINRTELPAGTAARAAHTCPVEQSDCCWIDRCHGAKGAGRSPSIRRGFSTNRVLAMATSAIWRVM